MDSVSPMRILLVEDDDVMRKALAKAVRSFGHTCETAKDGQEAWEIHQPNLELDVDAWLARADAALYKAKAAGRNRIVLDELVGDKRGASC